MFNYIQKLKNTFRKALNLFKIDEKISILKFVLSIVISIAIAFCVFKVNNPRPCQKSVYFDNSITGYIAIIGSLPTVYLWVVKEKKKEKDLLNKEKDLLNKEKELYQNKISELNKVYV